MKMSRHWLWMLFVPVVWLGLSRLRLGTDVLDLLPPGQTAVQGLKLYQQYFANARELILTLKAHDAEQAEIVAKEITFWLRQETNWIAEAAWQPPWMEDPAQLGELLACLRLNQEPQAFGELTNRLAPGNLKTVLAGTREVLATSLSPLEMARHAFDPYGLVDLPGSNSLGGAAQHGYNSGNPKLDGASVSPKCRNFDASKPWPIRWPGCWR